MVLLLPLPLQQSHAPRRLPLPLPWLGSQVFLLKSSVHLMSTVLGESWGMAWSLACVRACVCADGGGGRHVQTPPPSPPTPQLGPSLLPLPCGCGSPPPAHLRAAPPACLQTCPSGSGGRPTTSW